MSETAPEATAPEAAQPTPETPTPAEDKTDWQAEARKWEQRAKENRDAARELEKQRQASMTEAERAVAEAETRGRTAAASQFGQRLVRSEFTAAAARVNAEFDVTTVLDDLNLTKFVGEDGEPDSKAIQKAAERLIPAGNRAPSFDGGPRTQAPAAFDFNQQIRKAAGRA
jgi:hypothetical protein